MEVARTSLDGSGLRVGPVGRVIVGAAMAVTVGFMLWTAWHNVFP